MPKRRKTRTHVPEDVVPRGATVYNEKTKGSVALSSTEDVIPKSIVAKGSKVIPVVNELVKDIRRMMHPNTASKLKEKNSNRMKDYTSVASALGVSHVLVITQTKSNLILRIGRVPNGPTLHFKIIEYSLVKHVKALQKHPFESTDAFLTAPLVVLNNFNQVEESHIKLMRITFQNMFPSINVKTVKLSECRRVVLFHYNKEDGSVQMRHYAIKASPVGINKNIKRILQSKIPNLGHLQDISEFLENSNTGNVSDSEPDDDEGSKVVLSEKYNGKGNIRNQKSAMKLVELGPRITLEIFKVEQGLGEGEVMYHKYQSKSSEEAAVLKSRIEKARLMKIERKAKQDANVKRKQGELEQKKQLKTEKKRQKLENNANSKVVDSDDDNDNDDDVESNDADGDDDDDDIVDDEDDLDDDNEDEISDDDEDE